jgi:allantoin racemase
VSARRILLINPNTSDLVTQILLREAQRFAGERATIHAASPSFGSASLECRAEAVIAAHGVIETIAAQRDFDATIIAAFGDPGLEAAREIASPPVYGLGQCGFEAVAANGRRYGVVTVGRRLRPDIERAAALHAPAAPLVAVRFLDVTVLEAVRNRSAVRAAALEAAKDCAEREGAEAILLGGAPFAGMARAIGPRLAAPVYDGLEAAIEQAIAAPRRQASIVEEAARKERPGVSAALAERIDRYLGSKPGC